MRGILEVLGSIKQFEEIDADQRWCPVLGGILGHIELPQCVQSSCNLLLHYCHIALGREHNWANIRSVTIKEKISDSMDTVIICDAPLLINANGVMEHGKETHYAPHLLILLRPSLNKSN